MKRIGDSFWNWLSFFLNVLAGLFCVTCASSDGISLTDHRDTEVKSVVDSTMNFSPLENVTALRELLRSPNYSKLLELDGQINYSDVTKNSTNNVFYFLLYNMNAEEEITVVVTPCLSPITWKLLYRIPTYDHHADVFSESIEDKILYQYTGSEQTIFSRSVATGGLYLVNVSCEQNTTIQIHVSTLKGGQELLNISNFRTKNRIQVVKRFDTYPPIARLFLPKLNIEFEQFYLLFVISKKKFYHSICNVVSTHPDKSRYFAEGNLCGDLQTDSELQICREDGHRSQVDFKLDANNSYYISVFVWDLNGFSALYSKIHFKFKQFPERLYDSKPRRMNMTSNGGKFSFKYKIRKQNVRANSTIFFYVLPCGDNKGLINVEIKREKRVIIRDKISRYKKFEIPNSRANQRYVIRIKNGFAETVSDSSCSLIEVMATMRPKEFPLPPKHPSDIRVNATAVCPKKSTNFRGIVANISWLPIVSNEALVYCIYVDENPTPNKMENIMNSTDILYPLLTNARRNHVCTKFPSWNPQNESCPFIFQIRKLKARVNYAIQVIVKKHKQSERFLSYRLLNVQLECPADCSGNIGSRRHVRLCNIEEPEFSTKERKRKKSQPDIGDELLQIVPVYSV